MQGSKPLLSLRRHPVARSSLRTGSTALALRRCPGFKFRFVPRAVRDAIDTLDSERALNCWMFEVVGLHKGLAWRL